MVRMFTSFVPTREYVHCNSAAISFVGGHFVQWRCCVACMLQRGLSPLFKLSEGFLRAKKWYMSFSTDFPNAQHRLNKDRINAFVA